LKTAKKIYESDDQGVVHVEVPVGRSGQRVEVLVVWTETDEPSRGDGAEPSMADLVGLLAGVDLERPPQGEYEKRDPIAWSSGRDDTEDAFSPMSRPNPNERIKDVRANEDALSADLIDGRTITVPLAWFPRLLHATSEQRNNWQVSAAGFGIHWPDVDEDVSSEGLLRGTPAPVGQKGAA
jgi:hypothetical protein